MDSGSSHLHGACVPLALQPLAVAEVEHSLEPVSGCVLGLRAALSPCGARVLPSPPAVPRVLPSPPAVPASCPLPLRCPRPAVSPCGARVLPSPPAVPASCCLPLWCPASCLVPLQCPVSSVQWAHFVPRVPSLLKPHPGTWRGWGGLQAAGSQVWNKHNSWSGDQAETWAMRVRPLPPCL